MVVGLLLSISIQVRLYRVVPLRVVIVCSIPAKTALTALTALRKEKNGRNPSTSKSQGLAREIERF